MNRDSWHRRAVGGMWDQMGRLQLEFLIEHGLKPDHSVIDVGCGSLRAGLHLIRYLAEGGYCGVDASEPLLDMGSMEVALAGLDSKQPQLLCNARFRLREFDRLFDYALAQSLWTHLPLNSIVRCAVAVSQVLNPGGVFYATFFEVPDSADALRDVRQANDVTTKFDQDPYHYPWPLLSGMVTRWSGLHAELIGDWGHPRNQKMAMFRKP